MGKCK